MPRRMVKTESYREALLESLRNPDEAAHYLNACLEDEDSSVFLLALRDVADAHGGIRAISRETELNREKPLSYALEVRKPIVRQSGVGPARLWPAPRGPLSGSSARQAPHRLIGGRSYKLTARRRFPPKAPP